MASSFDENDGNERLIDLDDSSEEDEVQTSRRSARKNVKPPRPPKVPSTSKGEFSSQKRKNASDAWNHFSKTDDPNYAICNYCNGKFACASRNGTSNLSTHTLRCKKAPANLDKKQKLINFETTTVINDDGSTETISVPKVWNFNQEVARRSLARMVIVDELSFMCVEKEGFKGFCNDMNPQFIIPSRFTLARDCYALFIEGRKKLHDFFGRLSSRVCLTTDAWTSGQNLGYMCLTAHFIDDNWVLHKRIINFCQQSGHTGKIIGKTVEKCLSEWNLKNIMTVTVDNASSNDVAIDYLRRKFNNSECDVMEGKYLHMRCAAHILNLVVKEGLEDLDDTIIKIRTLCKYVEASPARKEKFAACIIEEKIECKSQVILDCPTRWNSTFLMLEIAVQLKKAFGNLLRKDSNLKKELEKVGDKSGNLTNEEWKRVSYFLPFLKIFYDATLKLSGSRYITSNYYVEIIFGVGEVISQNLTHKDEGVRDMASKMKSKYEKYWGKIENLNLLMFVSLILDPRYKMTYVEWMVKTIYGEKGGLLALNIKYFFQTFFDFYVSSIPKTSNSASSSSTTTNILPQTTKQDDTFNFGALLGNKFEMEMGEAENEMKSEWEKYLSDDRESRQTPLNILQWWKDNQKRYPILAKMARDVLAIPVSTVASESAFSTGGRVLDSFRTCLNPRMVEALICSQDWLRTSQTPMIIEETLLQLENIEEGEGMEELVLQQPLMVIDKADADDE